MQCTVLIFRVLEEITILDARGEEGEKGDELYLINFGPSESDPT